MGNLSELLITIKPYVLGWISGIGGGNGPFAPSPHDLNSAHHSGAIADTQGPQFLLSNGGRALTGNLTVSPGVTIDGVDLSMFSAEAFVMLGNTTGLPNERALTQGSGITITDGGPGSAVTVAVDATVARNTWPVNAGAGLTGGGNLSAGGITIAVGAGAGITVNADDVALTTPGGLSATSTNSAMGNHTHAIDSTIARSAVTITGAGALGGGGDLTANRTITMNTPGGLSVSSTNSATTNHTHAIASSSNPGSAASLLASDATGALQLTSLTLSGNLNTSRVASHLIPVTTDTYDLGSSALLWRQGYLSQLSALIFAEQTIQLLGGWLMVPKDAGTLPEVSSARTQIDFGKTMTPGHFILVRAHDTGGAIKAEYMQIGSLVEGTTYNVTRDVAGAHGTDPAWADGTPYALLGTTGDGRIEINAYDTPRIQLISQGGTYNAQTELIRIGDLNGNWGYTSQIFGMGIGEYASGKSSITVESTNGVRILNGATTRIGLTTSGILTINNSSGSAVFTFNTAAGAEFTLPLTLGSNGGIYQGSGTFAAPSTGLKIWNDSGVGRIAGYNGGSMQWYANTDGKLYAGGGSVYLDANGINLATGYSIGGSPSSVKWISGGTVYGHIAADTSSQYTVYRGASGTGAISFSIVKQSDDTNLLNVLFASDNGSVSPYQKFVDFNSNGLIRLLLSQGVGSTTKRGVIFVNDTDNSFMTSGITINQDNADNEILAFKSRDVGHSFTTDTEADTFGCVRKNNATNGGLVVDGFGTGVIGIRLTGSSQTGTTTKATNASARISLDAWALSGSTRGAIGANENIVVFCNGSTTRFILDGDGDSHQDVGTAWTNFDTHNDVELLTALSVQVSRENDPIRTSFNAFLTYNRQRLEELKLVTFNEDGHHFVNMSRLTMLLVGAVRQLDRRLSALEAIPYGKDNHVSDYAAAQTPTAHRHDRDQHRLDHAGNATAT